MKCPQIWNLCHTYPPKKREYWVSIPELARHRALRRVIRERKEVPLSLFRRLNVLMILFRYKYPKLSQLFRNERNYVKKMLR